MPANTTFNIFESAIFLQFLRFSILIILFFYTIFALMIVRQTDLMAKTLITPVSPLVKAIAIIHGGFTIAFLVLAFGIL